ncbi:MAG: CehA/McbA family metallohydrolase [Bacteroidales bacterium]|nr:CehA/McbA family metallohydrolase [Bacteroidales bacterium]
MKLISIIYTLLFIYISDGYSQYSIGGYNVYFGDLHNHTGVSDGEGTPQQAYYYARYTADLDFFGLSDHSDVSGSINPIEWLDIIVQANYYNLDGVFTAFYGFEWTNNTYGHINVFNTDNICKAEDPLTNTFLEFVGWLSEYPNSIAFFNHPGYWQADPQLEFGNFATTPSNQFVGIELWNAANSFNHYDNEPGYYSGDNGKSYYDEANSRGWKIGASGGGDEHHAEWGTRFPSRMAILANNLTRDDLLAAMKARRFYSTLDKNLCLSFKINGKEMGSSVIEGYNTVQIQAKDGEDFESVIIYNQDHEIIDDPEWYNLNTDEVNISTNINMSYGDYFYVRIKQEDGDEAISSPIWVSICATTTLIQNRVITMDETINGCAVKLYNVTIQNNADVIINANDNTILEDFEIKAGSTLEIE